MKDIRSPIARGWYPDNPLELSKSLEKYLTNAKTDKPKGILKGIIVPHAGHMYSGQVAAYAFTCLENLDFDTVVVVSPYHYTHTGNVITTSHEAYETPLGIVKVDHSFVKELDLNLKKRLPEGLNYVSDDEEHAIEVELPFLQHILSDFKLVPLMISNQTLSVAQALGQSISSIISSKNALLVASSDLSHYYSETIAKTLDSEILRLIEEFDPEGVIEADEQGKGFACGRAAIATVLIACREIGANNVKVLNYSTSGDVSGDYNQVVGYGAAAIWQ